MVSASRNPWIERAARAARRSRVARGGELRDPSPSEEGRRRRPRAETHEEDPRQGGSDEAAPCEPLFRETERKAAPEVGPSPGSRTRTPQRQSVKRPAQTETARRASPAGRFCLCGGWPQKAHKSQKRRFPLCLLRFLWSTQAPPRAPRPCARKRSPPAAHGNHRRSRTGE